MGSHTPIAGRTLTSAAFRLYALTQRTPRTLVTPALHIGTSNLRSGGKSKQNVDVYLCEQLSVLGSSMMVAIEEVRRVKQLPLASEVET